MRQRLRPTSWLRSPRAWSARSTSTSTTSSRQPERSGRGLRPGWRGTVWVGRDQALGPNIGATWRSVFSVRSRVADDLGHALWHESGSLAGMRLVPRQLTEIFGDRDGVFPSACRQYRASMNQVASWALGQTFQRVIRPSRARGLPPRRAGTGGRQREARAARHRRAGLAAGRRPRGCRSEHRRPGARRAGSAKPGTAAQSVTADPAGMPTAARIRDVAVSAAHSPRTLH